MRTPVRACYCVIHPIFIQSGRDANPLALPHEDLQSETPAGNRWRQTTGRRVITVISQIIRLTRIIIGISFRRLFSPARPASRDVGPWPAVGPPTRRIRAAARAPTEGQAICGPAANCWPVGARPAHKHKVDAGPIESRPGRAACRQLAGSLPAACQPARQDAGRPWPAARPTIGANCARRQMHHHSAPVGRRPARLDSGRALRDKWSTPGRLY